MTLILMAPDKKFCVWLMSFCFVFDHYLRESHEESVRVEGNCPFDVLPRTFTSQNKKKNRLTFLQGNIFDKKTQMKRINWKRSVLFQKEFEILVGN